MPLEYRDKGTSGTQWAVITVDLIIGSIRKNTLSVVVVRQVAWEWTLSVSAAPPGFQHHGRADNLEQAKAQIEAQWSRWLAAVGLHDGA